MLLLQIAFALHSYIRMCNKVEFNKFFRNDNAIHAGSKRKVRTGFMMILIFIMKFAGYKQDINIVEPSYSYWEKHHYIKTSKYTIYKYTNMHAYFKA